MELDPKIMDIDAEKVSQQIVDFMRDQLQHFFKKRGLVIGLSGGIDSSVAAALAVRAVGTKRVFGVLLPEHDSNPKSRPYGQLMAESLGIEYSEVNISPMLETYGVYAKRDAVVKKYFPDLSGDYKFRLSLPQDLLERDRINAYSLEVQKSDGTLVSARLSYGDYLEMMAANDIKQRTRMTVLYYEAEKRNYVVCGTTNRPETAQGFFVKFGDGGVDIEPLGPLYKNQVFQLGRHLGIPEEILTRAPSPDTYSLEVSDKDFYFCLPYDTVDMFLYAQDHSISKEETAKALGLEMEQVDRVWKDLERKRDATAHLRTLPPSPDLGI
jgi:NAD+ synthase